MKTKLEYSVYGLNIYSDIYIPELTSIPYKKDKTDNVYIIKEKLTHEIHELILNSNYFFYSNNCVGFYIVDVATFLIEDGKRITIELCENADMSMVKQYLLGSCLGIILLQRNMIAIHGGSIVFNDKGVIFTGDCGAGKSTITSALRLNGYHFLTDDVSSLDVSHSPLIHPGFPQQKLCIDAMTHFGYDETTFNRVMGDTKMKYLVPVHESFVNHQIPLHAIVELVPSDEVESIEVETLLGYEKLMAIYRNIYRIEMKQLLGVDTDYFKKCVAVAKHVTVYRMKRPKNMMSVDAQIEWLEKTFLEKLEA